MPKKASGKDERIKARHYLKRLGLQDHPLYKEDPVHLLGIHAVDDTDNYKGSTALVRSNVDDSREAIYTPQYHEIARFIVPCKGQIHIAGDTTLHPGEALSVPLHGNLNALVISGEWPESESNFSYGRTRVIIKETLSIYFPPDDEQFNVPIQESGIYDVEIRAYENSPVDLIINLSPTKELHPAAVFVT